MAHSYVVSLHHCVFSTAKRERILKPAIRPELFKYLAGISNNHEITLMLANGVEDHLHMLIGLPSTLSIAKAMQLLKGNSSKWLRDDVAGMRRFQWQEGYGAFSIGISQVQATLRYIENQQEHHRRVTFEEEYQKFLVRHGIKWLPDEALG
jgi:REP element-mobilizing transposase RayT